MLFDMNGYCIRIDSQDVVGLMDHCSSICAHTHWYLFCKISLSLNQSRNVDKTVSSKCVSPESGWSFLDKSKDFFALQLEANTAKENTFLPIHPFFALVRRYRARATALYVQDCPG